MIQQKACGCQAGRYTSAWLWLHFPKTESSASLGVNYNHLVCMLRTSQHAPLITGILSFWVSQERAPDEDGRCCTIKPNKQLFPEWMVFPCLPVISVMEKAGSSQLFDMASSEIM